MPSRPIMRIMRSTSTSSLVSLASMRSFSSYFSLTSRQKVMASRQSGTVFSQQTTDCVTGSQRQGRSVFWRTQLSTSAARSPVMASTLATGTAWQALKISQKMRFLISRRHSSYTRRRGRLNWPQLSQALRRSSSSRAQSARRQEISILLDHLTSRLRALRSLKASASTEQSSPRSARLKILAARSSWMEKLPSRMFSSTLTLLRARPLRESLQRSRTKARAALMLLRSGKRRTEKNSRSLQPRACCSPRSSSESTRQNISRPHCQRYSSSRTTAAVDCLRRMREQQYSLSWWSPYLAQISPSRRYARSSSSTFPTCSSCPASIFSRFTVACISVLSRSQAPARGMLIRATPKSAQMASNSPSSLFLSAQSSMRSLRSRARSGLVWTSTRNFQRRVVGESLAMAWRNLALRSLLRYTSMQDIIAIQPATRKND